MYPKREKNQEITILDVGCAYAGYLITISPLVEKNLCLGIEIRRKVKKLNS
jgi:tRNA G46 methylase TrmB